MEKNLNILNKKFLKGNELKNRMLELAFSNTIKEEKIQDINNFEFLKEGPDGKLYGIVRDKGKYWIKFSNEKENLNESNFSYLGGVNYLKSNGYDSYSKALNKLNIVFSTMNKDLELNSPEIKLLGEADKKYVIKQRKNVITEPQPEPMAQPFPEAPQQTQVLPQQTQNAPMPDMNAQPPAAPDMGMGGMDNQAAAPDMGMEMGVDDTNYQPTQDAEVQQADPNVNIDATPELDNNEPGTSKQRVIRATQKLTGKLAQIIKMNTDFFEESDYKYVINSLFSSIPIADLSEKYKDQLVSKLVPDDDLGIDDKELGLDEEMELLDDDFDSEYSDKQDEFSFEDDNDELFGLDDEEDEFNFDDEEEYVFEDDFDSEYSDKQDEFSFEDDNDELFGLDDEEDEFNFDEDDELFGLDDEIDEFSDVKGPLDENIEKLLRKYLK